jgi:prevent-host-death family protein
MVDALKILPITKVKKELLDIIKVMADEDSTITVTRNGKPVSVMMTPGRYEALLETIEILGDKKILKALEASRKDFKSGRVYTHEEVWQD